MNAHAQSARLARAKCDRTVEVSVAHSLDDLMQAVAVRAAVYMEGQACPFAEEFDGNDLAGATHLIARLDGEPAGVLRLRWFAGFVKVERVAVRSAFRDGAVAEALMTEAMRLAEQKGYRRLIGQVQARLLPYWTRRFGLRRRGGRPVFVFSDHRYVEVERDLHPPPEALDIDSDPYRLIRPEGAWDRPGVLDRSAARPASGPC